MISTYIDGDINFFTHLWNLSNCWLNTIFSKEINQNHTSEKVLCWWSVPNYQQQNYLLKVVVFWFGMAWIPTATIVIALVYLEIRTAHWRSIKEFHDIIYYHYCYKYFFMECEQEKICLLSNIKYCKKKKQILYYLKKYKDILRATCSLCNR